MKKVTDKNGIEPKEGDIVQGLYEQGKDEGVVIMDEGILAVKDKDGDIIELASAFSGNATIKKQTVGTMEGYKCNRNGCEGVLEYSPSENCSCHINPPCTSCTSVYLLCPVCGWEE